MPQNVPFPVAPAYPANLTALTDGDSNNGANHLAVMEDVAQAVQYVKDRADVADGLLAANNTWTGLNTFGNANGIVLAGAATILVPNGCFLTCSAGSSVVFSGSVGFNPTATVLFGSGSTVTQSATVTITGTTATTAYRTSQVASASAAATLTVEQDVWYVDTPSFALSGVYTIKSTVPAPPANTSMQVLIFGLAGGRDIDIQREGGASIIQFTAAGTGFSEARLRFIGGSWRLAGYSGDNTVAVGTP